MAQRSIVRTGIRWGLFAAAVLLVLLLAFPHLWAWHHLRSARAALARYAPAEALKSLKVSLGVWGWRPSLHLLASRAARQAGDLETAQKELRECQRLLGATTPESVFEWSLLQASSGNVVEVEEYIQKRANLSPELRPLAWEALAEGYLRVYRLSDGMNCLSLWLKEDPNNLRALELRGITYVTGKGVARGADDYRNVLARDPGRIQTRWRLIGSLLDLGGYEEAAQNLEVYMQANPDDPESASRLARCYTMLNRDDEAVALLKNVLAKHPDDKFCLRTMGQFALVKGQFDEAESTLRHAVAVWPEDYQTQWLLFEAFRRQGKDTEAKAQNIKAQEIKDQVERIGELQSRQLGVYPFDPTLHYEMGMLLIRTGHPEVGEQWLRTALSIDPNHEPSQEALLKIGDKQSADQHRNGVQKEK